MPFVANSLDGQNSEFPTNTQKIFIGRTNEIDFFIQSILKPRTPVYNIISIFGRRGVGKSTLLTHLIEMVNSSEFKNQCLIAIVNKRQATPSDIMEEFSDHLRDLGYPLTKFESELSHFKDKVHQMQLERDTSLDALGQKIITDLTSATLKDVPFLGDILEKEVPSIIEASAQEFQYRQSLKEVKRQDDPLGSLTKAFVDDLNYLATLPVPTNVNRVRRWGRITRLLYSFAQHLPWFSGKQDRQMKILLFFDAFDHLAPETGHWLLNPFLESTILSNIVLVIASYKSITQYTPDDPQLWQPYFYKNNIYLTQLESLTKAETRSFLAAKGITDADKNEKVWNLSDGLPLYLSFLTSNPQGQVDPNADVIVNFLSWPPEVKQKLIKDTSLISRPFDLFDLSAFPYLPEDKDELQKLYFWLIEQPFVRLIEGRYIYHELARELFSSHLYNEDLAGYYSTRRTLANHYAGLLKPIREEWGKAVIVRQNGWS